MKNSEPWITEFESAFGILRRGLKHMGEQWLSRLGLTYPQVGVLMMMREQAGPTTGDVAARLSVTHSAATQTIDTLVRRGLVVRQPDDADRRVVRLQLSPAGEKLTADIRASHRQWLAQVFGELSEAERSAIISAMTKLAQVIEAHNTKPERK